MSRHSRRSILNWTRRTAFVSQSSGTLSGTSEISTPPDERAIPDAASTLRQDVAMNEPAAVTWLANEVCSPLLRVAHLFSSFVVNAELLRHRLQRGIELHERMFDSGMGVMAGITAIALEHGLRGLTDRVKAVVGPLIRVAAGVHYFSRPQHPVTF